MSKKPRAGEMFEQWFDRQKGLPNFKGREISRYFSRPKNSYPPRYKWTRFLEVMKVVQMVRDHFGKPVTVTSSYRSPEYNKSVGGVKYSQHMEFRAADIQVKDVSPRLVKVYLLQLRRAGVFKGGVGGYRTFTHVDTRGRNATWGR